uniref:Uncharacterized protein n=1 Tax=Glossina palpalis gambiensis TaxID=67801 RepID=A0A1B0BU80_9MUSC
MSIIVNENPFTLLVLEFCIREGREEKKISNEVDEFYMYSTSMTVLACYQSDHIKHSLLVRFFLQFVIDALTTAIHIYFIIKSLTYSQFRSESTSPNFVYNNRIFALCMNHSAFYCNHIAYPANKKPQLMILMRVNFA